MDQLEIEVSGRVQGVNYRSTIANNAKSLGLIGFAENKKDGTVFILVQGEREKLEEFIRISQKGSPLTKVEGMSFKFTKIKKLYNDFVIKTEGGAIKDKISAFTTLGKRVKNKVTGSKNIVNVPKHIAIIPDGNRRWARNKNWKPWVGHIYAAKNKNNLMKLFEESMRLGVQYVTFWAFSTENWKRDSKEVETIFNLVRTLSGQFLKESQKFGIKFQHIGRKDRLPEDILQKIKVLENKTKNYSNLNIQFALDYNGKDEIIRAFNKIQENKIEKIDENVIKRHLDTGEHIPDPDLIIRTGGEKRTSGILMWQAEYAELYFTDILFPDFDAEQLRLAVLDYSYRTRRFGGDSSNDFKNISTKELIEPDENELNSLAYI